MPLLFSRYDYELLPEGTPVELWDGLSVKQPSRRHGHQRFHCLIVERLHTKLVSARSDAIRGFELVPDEPFEPTIRA